MEVWIWWKLPCFNYLCCHLRDNFDQKGIPKYKVFLPQGEHESLIFLINFYISKIYCFAALIIWNACGKIAIVPCSKWNSIYQAILMMNHEVNHILAFINFLYQEFRTLATVQLPKFWFMFKKVEAFIYFWKIQDVPKPIFFITAEMCLIRHQNDSKYFGIGWAIAGL